MKRADSRSVPPGDDLDALLRAYFQAEMPSSWPGFRRPSRVQLPAAPERPPARLTAWSSRWTLALALALLILVGWLLPRPAPSSGPSPGSLSTLGDGTAGRGVLPTGPTRPARLTPERRDPPADVDPAPDLPMQEFSPRR